MTTLATRPGVGHLRGNKPRGVVLNRKALRTVREVALDHYDAEYLYLRENELTRFDADVKLDYLRVLDLSINDIEGAVNFLERMPHLHHLYMTGNKINTLAGVCNYSLLETLCLSDNNISSFAGLENLPNLRVLSLNFNSITSFDAYPILPTLHTLNLVGNPIAEVAAYRSMAIAVNNADLVSIDGNTVQEEERAAVEHYRGKIVFCIRHGFIVDGDVDEAATAFLLKWQRERAQSQPLQLRAMRIAADDAAATAAGAASSGGAAVAATTHAAATSMVVTEGTPITFALCLQDMRPYAQRTAQTFHSRQLFPVIFKVSGVATEVFAVGSMNNWTDPIELERCEDEDGSVYFHTTLYLPAGDYEYRYIVDGVETVSSAGRMTSKYNQGFCNLYQVTDPAANRDDDDDDDADAEDRATTLLHVRWMRSTPSGVYEVVDGATSLQYTPQIDDIGCCLRAEVLAYTDTNFSFLYFDVTSPVLAAAPTCTRLQLHGNAIEGEVLSVEAEYAGGVEGNSALSWFRIAPDGSETAVEAHAPPPQAAAAAAAAASAAGAQQQAAATSSSPPPQPQRDLAARYKLTLHDVGCRIRAVFTPVRHDWVAGQQRSVTSDIIAPAAPECVSIKVLGVLIEGCELQAKVVYRGGTEGESVYQWLRGLDSAASASSYVAIEGATASHYVSVLEDVGKCLAVEYTPVSSEGREGETCRCVLDIPIEAATPQVRQLTIVGKPQAGHVLSLEYAYTGGHAGAHRVQWSRRRPHGAADDVAASRKAIGEVDSEFVTLTEAEVGCIVEVALTPVRRGDGATGATVHAHTACVIAPAATCVRAIALIGTPAVGCPMRADIDGDGIDVARAQYTWLVEDAANSTFAVVARDTACYTPQPADAGKLLKLMYTPVSYDGIEGETCSCVAHIRPITPPAPSTPPMYEEMTVAEAEAEAEAAKAAAETTAEATAAADAAAMERRSDEMEVHFEAENNASAATGESASLRIEEHADPAANTAASETSASLRIEEHADPAANIVNQAANIAATAPSVPDSPMATEIARGRAQQA